MPIAENNKLIQHVSQVKYLDYGLESFYKKVGMPATSSRTQSTKISLEANAIIPELCAMAKLRYGNSVLSFRIS